MALMSPKEYLLSRHTPLQMFLGMCEEIIFTKKSIIEKKKNGGRGGKKGPSAPSHDGITEIRLILLP